MIEVVINERNRNTGMVRKNILKFMGLFLVLFGLCSCGSGFVKYEYVHTLADAGKAQSNPLILPIEITGDMTAAQRKSRDTSMLGKEWFEIHMNKGLVKSWSRDQSQETLYVPIKEGKNEILIQYLQKTANTLGRTVCKAYAIIKFNSDDCKENKKIAIKNSSRGYVGKLKCSIYMTDFYNFRDSANHGKRRECWFFIK